MRTNQSTNMAIQIPSTPKPPLVASSVPRIRRNSHMDNVDAAMAKAVSPAARRVWGKVKAMGQNRMLMVPCIQMILNARSLASAETW